MKDKTLIGINAGVLNHHPTGVGIFTKNIVNCMSNLTNNMIVWLIDKDIIENNKYKVIEILPFLPFSLRTFSLVRAIWDQLSFPFEVKKACLNVVFFPIQEGMLFPPVPQIVFVHDLAPLNHPNGVPFFRRFSYRSRIPFILKKSAAIAVPTFSVKQELLVAYNFLEPSKISVISEGYDHLHFKQTSHYSKIVDGKYILFVGSRCENKNLFRMVEAFDSIKCLNCRLVIAGKAIDKKYAAKLDLLVLNKKLKDSVLFLEYVEYNDLPHLYAGAEMLLFPTLYEGFGLPILEAMACGTPVITSNCTAMPEVAGDAAILVDPHSVESISAAMLDILNNQARADELKKAGLERVKQFRWSRSAEKLYGLCRKVIEE